VTSTPQAVDPPDEVTARLRQGSREAMSQVFRTHLDVIYNYCYRRCGSWTVAEDLSSTVFLEVWRNRQRAVSVDEIAKGIPVYEVEGSVGSTATCEHRSNDTTYAEAIFQLDDSVALARVRLNRAGHPGPWQTATPFGGYVHFSIGLLGDDAWTESVTADYEFLDADGKLLAAMPLHDRCQGHAVGHPDHRAAVHLRRHGPPLLGHRRIPASGRRENRDDDLHRAGCSGGCGPEFRQTRMEAPARALRPEGLGGVLSKDGQQFACSLAPTREVGAVVPDKRTTAESGFWFAVNPIDANGGSSFWASGRVPAEVTSITYVLPSGDKVPAVISAEGYWMAMYHVDGKDLAAGSVSTWDPVRVSIKRSSGAPITYAIPFNEHTMCNQVSHGC
jgi:hypothetical protein